MDEDLLKLLEDTEPVRGEVELVFDQQHFQRVVLEGILKARGSLEIATADFKAMLTPVPNAANSRRRGSWRAPSIVERFVELADRGVEIRILHAGVPTSATLSELKRGVPEGLTIRRCPRLHAKTVIVDGAAMYLGSANLTGAGLGAKGETRRNFEWGVWSTSGGLIDAVLQRFNTLWEGAHCEGCGRRDVCPVPLEEPAL